MLNLVWLNLALQVLASFSKKQPSKVVFYFIVKGAGLELRSASSCERSEAKKLPTPFNPPSTTLFFVEATCCRLVTSKAVSSCLQAALAERSDR